MKGVFVYECVILPDPKRKVFYNPRYVSSVHYFNGPYCLGYELVIGEHLVQFPSKVNLLKSLRR